MKLLHAADFHLDSPLSGLPQSKSAQRRRELREIPARLARLAQDEGVDLVGDLLVGRAGGEGGRNVRDVAGFGHCGDEQGVGVAEAPLPARLQSADARRTGPAFAVLRTLCPADVPHPVGKEQVGGLKEFILHDGQRTQLLRQQFPVHMDIPSHWFVSPV